jgi:hypothetical protein
MNVSQSHEAKVGGEVRTLEFLNLVPLANVVCGSLVFASHWLVPLASGGGNQNLFASGLAIIVVSIASLVAHGQVARNYWSALNVPIGIWLVVSANILPLPVGIGWTQTCMGILAGPIALTSLANERRAAKIRSAGL